MKHIIFRIYAKAIGVQVILILAMRKLLPILANYPLYSEELQFQQQVEKLTHNQQYIILGTLFIVIQIFFIHLFMKKIFAYLKKDKSEITYKETEEIRTIAFSIPRKLLIVQTFSVVLMISFVFSMVQGNFFLVVKFMIAYLSFFTAGWVLITALLQNEIDKIIASTYLINRRATLPKKQSKFYLKLMKNLLPFFLVILIVVSLIAYSKIIDLNGESKYNYYKQNLYSLQLNGLDKESVKQKLNQIPLYDDTNYYFIITGDEKFFSKPDGNASDFFIKYAENFLTRTKGRIHEYYGVEEEASARFIKLQNGQTALVGIKYSTSNESVLYYFLLVVAICITIYVILLWFWTRNISKNLTRVSIMMAQIAKKYNVDKEVTILPALSNDEIGQLVISFNAIRHRTKENITKIRNSQNMLMEKERLATLGQMVGGIAHNLKTPIMSIAGAMEGLEDLVDEYEKSITDPEVTLEDHREIAKDMKSWISKVNSYDAYMSDVITTVKGQAVNFNDESTDKFTIEDLLKRINILMKQELKSSLVTLNVECDIPQDTEVSGNVNSLVQIVNNLISNAIQSYGENKKQNESLVEDNNKIINLIISQTKDKIIITVEDFGSGIPKDVQDKLFKSMVTTKGRNGTGLGLFMSYSTVKGHFNGEMTFKSKVGKGTTFKIVIPK